MRKKILLMMIAVCLLLSLSACSASAEQTVKEEATEVEETEVEIPEMVRSLQHKIDKALESEPTYDDIVEIQNEYDDLLMAEQAMIKNYDKIEKMVAIDENLVSCVYAAQKLQARLKNPSSLQIISAKCCNTPTKVAVKLDYSATNDLGGTVESTDYCLVVPPTQNEQGEWTCYYDYLYATVLQGELIDALSESITGVSTRVGRSSDDIVRDSYEEGSAIEVNAHQVMDNLSLSILEPSDD